MRDLTIHAQAATDKGFTDTQIHHLMGDAVEYPGGRFANRPYPNPPPHWRWGSAHWGSGESRVTGAPALLIMGAPTGLDLMDLSNWISDVPDFPQKGIVFKDITPLLQEPAAFSHAIDRFEERYRAAGIQHVVAIEARGFIFGAPLALRLGAAFVPVRKKGKLPRRTVGGRIRALSTGRRAVELHQDGVVPGQRVLIVDDVLATGGTAAAAKGLIEHLGGLAVGAAFVVELGFPGRARQAPRHRHFLSRHVPRRVALPWAAGMTR